MQIQKKNIDPDYVDYRSLVRGEVYESMNEDAYKGYVLYVVAYGSDIYGVWLNDGGGVFAKATVNYEQFKFRKMQVKLVEL